MHTYNSGYNFLQYLVSFFFFLRKFNLPVSYSATLSTVIFQDQSQLIVPESSSMLHVIQKMLQFHIFITHWHSRFMNIMENGTTSLHDFILVKFVKEIGFNMCLDGGNIEVWALIISNSMLSCELVLIINEGYHHSWLDNVEVTFIRIIIIANSQILGSNLG